MFIKCVVSNIWWSDFFSWLETGSNKCFCNIIITRVTRPSPSWTRYQLVFYFRLSSAVRWLTEDLTRASVSLTTRWPWGACCPCWGPRKVTAPTTSVCRTDCRGPARLKVNSLSCSVRHFYYVFLLSGSSDNFMMMMMGWMLMAVVMYFLRPNSMRNNSTEGKPTGQFLSEE